MIGIAERFGNGVSFASLNVFNQTYAYDNVDRLTGVADPGYGRTFGYDQWGNMWLTGNAGIPLAGNTPTSNVFNGANQIDGASYDGAGNQTVVNGNTLAYNAENQVATVTEPASLGGGAETLAYDAAGQRVEKIQPAGATVYVYDAFGRLAAEYSTLTAASPCTTCYLVADQLGSTRLVTDQSGGVVARHDFLPFGEEIPANTAGRPVPFGPGSDSINQKFTGQMRDAETGLDYFNARYFAAAPGPVQQPGSGQCRRRSDKPAELERVCVCEQ